MAELCCDGDTSPDSAKKNLQSVNNARYQPISRTDNWTARQYCGYQVCNRLSLRTFRATAYYSCVRYFALVSVTRNTQRRTVGWMDHKWRTEKNLEMTVPHRGAINWGKPRKIRVCSAVILCSYNLVAFLKRSGRKYKDANLMIFQSEIA